MLRSVKLEKRVCPHCDNLDALFDRMRKVELLLAFLLGTTVVGGGSIAAKVFGILG
jgi:hypothetical protein